MSHLCSMCESISFKPRQILGLELHPVLEIEGQPRAPEPEWNTQLYFLHYPTRHELEASKKKCHLCALMADTLELKWRRRWNFLDCGPTQIFLTLKKSWSSDNDTTSPRQCKLEVWAGMDTWGEVLGKVYREDSTECDEWAKLYNPLTANDENHSTGSGNSMRLAKHWLQTCKKDHDCIPDTTPPLLPSRVIDVGIESSALPRLRVSKPGERDHYITLSYCWGDQKKINFLKTKTENITEHIRALPSPLHSTLQDAVRATRDLGFRYIWIDALCIIQNDKLDLDREISKMGLIYQNSSLTIGAGNGQDVTCGLFAKRDPFLSRPCFLALDIEGHRHRVSVNKFHYIYNVPLESRLWVAQEQILSRRMLFFCADRIEWRCCKDRVTERGPLAHLSSPSGYDINELQAVIHRPEHGTESFPFDSWYRAVSGLSGRKATFITDQLPAIAGVASVLHDSFDVKDPSKYLAGLWKDDLLAGLIWVRNKLSSPSDSSDSSSESIYIAPTWSWAASPAGSKSFPTSQTMLRDPKRDYRKFEKLVRIERIHVEPENATDNPFGKIKPGAHIRVVGKLKEAATRAIESEYLFETEIQALHNREPGARAGIFDTSNGEDDARIVGLISFDTMEQRKTLPTVYCLPILKYPSDTPCVAVCLGLIKVKDGFQRVGLIGLFREPRIIETGSWDDPYALDVKPGDIYWDDNIWDKVPHSTINIF